MFIDQPGRVAFASLLLILFTAPAHGHHGRDFLLTQTSHIPTQGDIYAIARQDYIDEGQEKEWEFEPGVIGSLRDWMALEVHSHIEKVTSQPTRFESTAITGNFRFTRRESAFALGGAIEYEFARQDDEEDVWEFAGIASYTASEWTFGFNLLAERDARAGAETQWGYAAGVRRTITDEVAAGLEFAGTFEREKEGEVLLEIFIDPLPWLTVNLGLGTGFDDGADFLLRSAFVFKFH